MSQRKRRKGAGSEYGPGKEGVEGEVLGPEADRYTLVHMPVRVRGLKGGGNGRLHAG